MRIQCEFFNTLSWRLGALAVKTGFSWRSWPLGGSSDFPATEADYDHTL
jgi:hypothetical protein